MLLTACQESLEDRCAREAKEYTRKNCLHYYYRLTGFADNDSIVERLGAANILKNELRNTTTLQLYKDNHYRFAYTYRSEKDPKKVLLDLVFTDKDY